MNEKYYGGWLPIDISTHGAGIDRLIGVLHIAMAVLFIGWVVFMMYTLVRFRQRGGHKADYHVKHFKAPTYIEVGVALFELVLLTAFAMPLWNQVRTERPPADKSLEVRVVAQQFAWNIHYPGGDGKFGKTDPNLMSASNPLGLDSSDGAAKDDITTINQMHVPVNKPVIVHLSSKDVIHSFTVPVMRVKQDSIPGETIALWFEAKDTGDFEIACAQLCGLGHYRMRGFFIVDTQEKFQQWLAEQAPAAPAPAEPVVQAAVMPAAGETHHE